jgi:RNA polymerase sigma-70 factor (ECF subfamily)
VDYSAISSEELVRICFETGNEQAWADFIRRFHPLIARVVIRVARQWGESSPQVIDDLIQDTYLNICERRGSLSLQLNPSNQNAIYGYIKVFTANLVHDQFKASHSQKRGGGVKPDSLDIGNAPAVERQSATSEVETIDRNLLMREIDSCLQSLDRGPNAVRDRRIFWLYYRVGLTAVAIAALPAIALTTKAPSSG